MPRGPALLAALRIMPVPHSRHLGLCNREYSSTPAGTYCFQRVNSQRVAPHKTRSHTCTYTHAPAPAGKLAGKLQLVPSLHHGHPDPSIPSASTQYLGFAPRSLRRTLLHRIAPAPLLCYARRRAASSLEHKATTTTTPCLLVSCSCSAYSSHRIACLPSTAHRPPSPTILAKTHLFTAISDDEVSDTNDVVQVPISSNRRGKKASVGYKDDDEDDDIKDVPPYVDAEQLDNGDNDDDVEAGGEDDEDDEEIGEDEFVVEKIVGHQVLPDGTIKFKVKWEGYEKKKDQTFEDEDNLK